MKFCDALPKLTENLWESYDRGTEILEEYLKWMKVPNQAIELVGALQIAVSTTQYEVREKPLFVSPLEEAAIEMNDLITQMNEASSFLAAALDGVKKQRFESCGADCPVYRHLEAHRPGGEGLN